MTDLRSLEVALTLIDLFSQGNGENWEKLTVGNILERMRFKELKTFNFKNLRRFHEINLKRKIPNNGVITPENTLLSQEILYYLEYLEEHTVYISEDWGKPSYEEAKWVCEKYQAEAKQQEERIKVLATGDSNLIKSNDDIPSHCKW